MNNRDLTPELIAKLRELTSDKPLSQVPNRTFTSLGFYVYEVLSELLDVYEAHKSLFL